MIIYRNTDQHAVGTLRNADGTLFDLTDKAVEFFVRTEEGVVLLYREANVDDPPTSGNYSIDFVPSDSVNIQDGEYFFGLLVRTTGSPAMLVYAGSGTLTVQAP